MQFFGKNLRTILKQKGITATELAIMTKISSVSICKYMGSKGVHPRIDKVVLIAKALDVSVLELLQGYTDEPVPTKRASAEEQSTDGPKLHKSSKWIAVKCSTTGELLTAMNSLTTSERRSMKIAGENQYTLFYLTRFY